MYCTLCSLALLSGFGMSHAASGSEECGVEYFPSKTPTDEEIIAATASSVIYFYPLLQYIVTYGPVLEELGSNVYEQQAELANKENEVVAIANVDTVYNRAIIDLSQNDYTLTIPEIDDRSHVIPFHDLYGNNFANLGTFSNASAGKYLLRRAEPGDEPLELGGDDSDYTAIINFPTTYGCSFPRILVYNQTGDPAEIAEILDFQSKFVMEPVNRTRDTPTHPSMTVNLLRNFSLASAYALGAQQLDPVNMTLLLDLAAKVVSYNLPVGNPDNAEVLKNLSVAGAMQGSYTPPANLNYTAVNSAINATLRAAATDPSNFAPTPNTPWTGWARDSVGNWFRKYALRAFTTGNMGYLAITTDVNYPRNVVGNPLTLGSDECFLFTFPRKPPLQDGGFWSLTAYGADRFLVANDLNRYSQGDRGTLTFPDGGLVYGESEQDGMFQILIQPADVAPPSNWTSNWLPAPAGGGPVWLFLRYYGPTDELTNGSYLFPLDTAPRPAITA